MRYESLVTPNLYPYRKVTQRHQQVFRNLNTYILGIDPVYDTLVAFKERVAPTNNARQLYLST